MRRFACAAGVAALVLLLLQLPEARAADLLGLYLGGAFGRARVDTSAPLLGQFTEDHSAFKGLVGVRPISLLGAELAYVDFGHPSRLNGILATDVTMKGAAAFGMLYLPVPLIDIYAKAGAARLQSTVGTQIVCPPGAVCIAIATPAPISRTNTSFAGGAGVQFKLGAFAVRGEYERFNAAGGNPYLLSLGATWTF